MKSSQQDFFSIANIIAETKTSATAEIKDPINKGKPQCLKITEKVSYNIASEARYILHKNSSKVPKIIDFEGCDILGDFQTLW